MDYNLLETALQGLGYGNLKKISSSKIAVLTDENRISVLEAIEKKIPAAVYDKKPGSDSSVGRVKVQNFTVVAKPASKQGRASAGTENEDILVNTVNKFAKNGPINVLFQASNKDYEVFGCVKAESVGTDTAGRKKADVVLIDIYNKKYPISIKKDNAEVWESADSYFGAEAQTIIEKAVAKKITNLTLHGSYFTIEPNIAVEATKKEKEDVVFGSDLKNNGSVITKTFSSNSFEFKEDLLIVDCSNIITSLSDVKGDKDVYFLIRNDKTRKSVKKYPGIRVLASYKKRINKNVKVVSRWLY